MPGQLNENEEDAEEETVADASEAEDESQKKPAMESPLRFSLEAGSATIAEGEGVGVKI
jgi:hypothetical protein